MANEIKAQYDVLIVDDNVEICEILQQYCKNLNCFKNILIANDGGSATAKLKNQKFGLILLDLDLPKRSGIEILSEFYHGSHNDKESVVIISGTLDQTKLAKLVNIGVKNILAKPFDEEKFRQKISKALSHIGINI